MQSVPKIVLDRLKAAQPPVNHPDTDVLTAFSEQSLHQRERATVIEHLARCHDCRDIVALALPQSEALQAVASPVRSSWFTWPTLRWAFVAAGIAAIASFGLVQYRRNSDLEIASRVSTHNVESTTVAKSEQPSGIATIPATSEKVNVPANATPSSNAHPTLIEPKPAVHTDALTARTHLPQNNGAIGGTAGGAVRGPLVTWQQNNNVQHQVPAPVRPQPLFRQQTVANSRALRVPPVSQNVDVTGQALQIEAQSENTSSLYQPDEQQSEEDSFDKVGKAKPATPASNDQAVQSAVVSGSVANQPLANSTGNNEANGNDLTQVSAMTPTVVPRWMITAAGSLQRSFDQGNTWQDVNVLTSAAPSANLMNSSITASTKELARAKKQDASSQTLKDQSASLVFRAVAATGAETWAGGSHGALYHSVDAGNHWVRVLPASSGAFLTGDIVRLEFPDPQHGKIATSTSEVWTTADSGLTWQKQ